MARKRYTREEKAAFLRKFKRSAGNAASFCRKHRLPYQTFLRWQRRSRLERVSEGAEHFVELEVQRPVAEDPRPADGPAVELVLGGGMVLRIYQGQGSRP